MAWLRKGGGAASYTCTELTPHARTHFEVIERFLPVRFSTQAAGQALRVASGSCGEALPRVPRALRFQDPRAGQGTGTSRHAASSGAH